MIGVVKTADISECGRFRWKLTRKWDGRPPLLVVLFNPSTADAEVDDQTITLLCFLASWNGYGSMTVVNLAPIRSSDPLVAFEMFAQRDAMLAVNERVVIEEAGKAGSILLGWGALGDRANGYDAKLLYLIKQACPHAKFFCLGITESGQPKHPMARGKHKVPKDQKFLEWTS